MNVLRFTLGLLTALRALNWVCAAVFALGLAMTFALEARMLAGLADDGLPGASITVLAALRWVAALGLATTLPAHFLLTSLRAITADVAAGHASAHQGAARLRVIAWSLLAIQLLDLAFGYVSYRYDSATGGQIGWSFGLTGWLAVLLLFVLARVFEEGAAMRDELEATV